MPCSTRCVLRLFPREARCSLGLFPFAAQRWFARFEGRSFVAAVAFVTRAVRGGVVIVGVTLDVLGRANVVLAPKRIFVDGIDHLGHTLPDQATRQGADGSAGQDTNGSSKGPNGNRRTGHDASGCANPRANLVLDGSPAHGWVGILGHFLARQAACNGADGTTHQRADRTRNGTDGRAGKCPAAGAHGRAST